MGRARALLINLIELEFLSPVGVVFQGLLLVFLQDAILQNQNIDRGAHETAVRVFGGAYDRLAAYVERRIDQQAATRFGFERLNQPVIARIGLLVHGLNARRIVDVSGSRNIRFRHVQKIDSPQQLLLLRVGVMRRCSTTGATSSI